MASDSPTYEDPSAPTSDRVADLLDRMTVEEKVGQLVGGWAGQFRYHEDMEEATAFVREYGATAISPFGWSGAANHSLEDVVAAANDLQETAREETRLGIPLLIPVDAVHGHAYVSEATVFPNGLGLAATWDPDHARRMGEVTASEMRATGAVQNYAPTVDVARDPRWGRTFETLGESPTLVSEFVREQVEGYQSGDYADDAVVATAKHFPAYGDPERGEDTSVVKASEYEVRNFFLPPAEAAVDAGVRSVMPCYNSINGDPVHGSTRYLQDLLREELGFDGHVVSDWGGIDHLHDFHNTAPDLIDAERQAREAGIDVASVGGREHVEAMLELVESGDLSEGRLDESVRRILEAKFELGLFEDPYVDLETAREVLGQEAHREAALEASRDAQTLLKNEGLLPLDRDADVLVAGPNADDLVRQRGGWTAYDGDLRGTTIREGIEAASDGSVAFEQGADVDERLDVEAAAEKAADADVAVVAVGEHWYLHEFVGEVTDTGVGNFPDRIDMHLPPAQRDLLEAIHETGTPTVGVLVSGRPLIVDWMDEHLPAVLMSYFPGMDGGQAVAETLYGDTNPGGKLPISVPKSEGHLPTYFNYLKHPKPIPGFHPPSYDPLYEFGHGLSYTDFEYGDVSLASETIAPDESATVAVEVENVGDRAGDEVVRLFFRDVLSTRVTPERELGAFERVSLDPGESTTVELEVDPDVLGFVDPDGDLQVEPGTFELLVADETVELEVE